MRKAGDRVRVTVQLIDAETDRHIWAERYDRDLDDIFAIQDEVDVARSPRTLPGRVEAAAQRPRDTRSSRPPTWRPTNALLAGKVLHHRATREDNAEALDRSTARSRSTPTTRTPHAWRGCVLGPGLGATAGWGDRRDATCERGVVRRSSAPRAGARRQRQPTCTASWRRQIALVRGDHDAGTLSPGTARWPSIPTNDLMVVQQGELII